MSVALKHYILEQVIQRNIMLLYSPLHIRNNEIVGVIC